MTQGRSYVSFFPPIKKDVEPILASQILGNVEFWSGGVMGWEGSRASA